MDRLTTWFSGNGPRYTAITESDDAIALGEERRGRQMTRPGGFWSRNGRQCLQVAGIGLVVLIAVHLGVTFRLFTKGPSGESQSIAQLWGQYSPFFSVSPGVDPSIPEGCEITFAQVLSRHGSRDPTAGKSDAYRELVGRIQDAVEDYGKGFEFLKDYEYTLGKDQLTKHGQQEMVDSGTAFYERYRAIAAMSTPFIRVSGQERVIVSGYNWTQGFFNALMADGHEAPKDGYIDDILVIPEEPGTNNTLSHGQCPAFEDGPSSQIGDDAKEVWQDEFMPPIAERVNRDLPGANLSKSEVTYLMDLCPFETVADPSLTLSPFCNLFSINEWRNYDYLQSVGKWYGFHRGNPLASTQGVGFANELIARLTGQAVEDATTTNSTLDGNEATFPLGRGLYADFSHDNDMMTIYAALGLYNETQAPSKTSRHGAEQLGGFSAAWTVPFGARMYVEKMRCGGGEDDEETVRILVNDRVVPLKACDADSLGRCRLDAFVDSLSFARNGGRWAECYA